MKLHIFVVTLSLLRRHSGMLRSCPLHKLNSPVPVVFGCRTRFCKVTGCIRRSRPSPRKSRMNPLNVCNPCNAVIDPNPCNLAGVGMADIMTMATRPFNSTSRGVIEYAFGPPIIPFVLDVVNTIWTPVIASKE